MLYYGYDFAMLLYPLSDPAAVNDAVKEVEAGAGIEIERGGGIATGTEMDTETGIEIETGIGTEIETGRGIGTEIETGIEIEGDHGRGQGRDTGGGAEVAVVAGESQGGLKLRIIEKGVPSEAFYPFSPHKSRYLRYIIPEYYIKLYHTCGSFCYSLVF